MILLFQRHKDQEERFARQLIEDRLRQTEHHYQQLVQSLPAAVYSIHGGDGLVVRAQTKSSPEILRPTRSPRR